MKQLLTTKKNKKTAFTLIELLIVIGIIVILAAMSQPNIHHGSRASSRQKRCFSNQRILQGAIEMYNMDNVDMMDNAIPGEDFETHEYILIKNGYLKDAVEPPETECSYGFVDLTGTGTVFCKKHGIIGSDIDKPTLPEYDSSRERPFTYAYNSFKEEMRKEKEFKAALQQINSFLLSPSFIIIVFIFIICFTIIGYGKKTKKKN